MRTYANGYLNRLDTALLKAGIADEQRAQIMAGGEEVGQHADSAERADWFRGALARMQSLLPEETCHSVREACACCLGGKREELTKAIAREHATLEERIAAANATPFVFGHSVAQQPDGRIRVRFFPDDATNLTCPCLREAREPMPILYCYCCGGHVKKHLQTALGHKLDVTVVTTVLSSGGREGCTFDLTLVD